MAQLCSWPFPVARYDSTPLTFSAGGVIVGVRDTTPADPVHPALLLVVHIGGHDFCRVAVPPSVWPAARELLAIGQFVGVEGTTDSSPALYGSRQVATEIRLVSTYHS